MPLLLFFLLTFQNLPADPVDTLAQALTSAKTDTERASLLEQNKSLAGVPLRKALLKNANTLMLKGEYERSRSICDVALQIARSIQDKSGEAAALIQRGVTYRAVEDFDEAEKHFQQAIAISQSIQDHEQYAYALHGMGKNCGDQQKYDEALGYYEKAIDLFQTVQDILGQAKTFNQMANVYDFQGNPKRALELYAQSLHLFESLKDEAGAAGVLVNRATVYADMGRNEVAIEDYARAEKVYKARGEKPNLAITLSNAGNSYQELGNFRLGMEYHIRALKIREELGSDRGIASSQINIGLIHEKQGNYELALDLYLRAYALIKKLGDRYLEGLILTNIGGIYAFTERYQPALEYFEKARVLREEVSDKSGVGSVFRAIAGTNELMGQYPEALEYYGKTLSIFEELNMKSYAAEALLGLSTAHFALNNFEESEKFATQAYEMTRVLDFPDLMWTILLQQARILVHKGENRRAEETLLQAIEIVESLRLQVAGAETASQQFLATRDQPFSLMVELLTRQNRNAEAFQFAERIKARVLLDVLQSGRVEVTKQMSAEQTMQEQDLTTELILANTTLQSEKSQEQPSAGRVKNLSARVQNARMALENFHTNLYAIHPDLRTQRAEIPSIRPEQIGEVLGAGNSCLEYSVSKTATFLFVWTRKNSESPSLHVIQIPVKQKVVAALTRTYLDQLGNRDLRAGITGQKLYQILVAPAAKYLAGQKSLVIVPDRELWSLPFQALQDADGKNLLERFSISYASSLSVLQEMKKIHQKQGLPSALLAMGGAIPHADMEVTHLAQFYGKNRSRIFTGQMAREGVLKREANNVQIIHVATHGVLDNASPMYSYLTLAKEENEDGLLEPREVLTLNLKTSLVVLSACETGGGKIGAGEGMIGFTWAFFVAGSPSTVVSQWKIDSESTAALMLEFHRNLKIGKLPKPEALRQAALKLRQDPRYRHPYYWAAFIVVGDPSPLL